MKRREFITLFGGAAAAWPLSARAQQGERMQRVGVLLVGAGNDPAWQVYADALRQGLTETGYVEGRNLAIEYRWAEGQYDRLPTLAILRKFSSLLAWVVGGLGSRTPGPFRVR